MCESSLHFLQLLALLCEGDLNRCAFCSCPEHERKLIGISINNNKVEWLPTASVKNISTKSTLVTVCFCHHRLYYIR